jgi:hypothetical protein
MAHEQELMVWADPMHELNDETDLSFSVQLHYGMDERTETLPVG